MARGAGRGRLERARRRRRAICGSSSPRRPPATRWSRRRSPAGSSARWWRPGPTRPTRPRRCSPGRLLDPEWGEAVRPLLEEKYAASPYVAYLRGESPDGYRALEDSLQAYVHSAAAAGRRPMREPARTPRPWSGPEPSGHDLSSRPRVAGWSREVGSSRSLPHRLRSPFPESRAPRRRHRRLRSRAGRRHGPRAPRWSRHQGGLAGAARGQSARHESPSFAAGCSTRSDWRIPGWQTVRATYLPWLARASASRAGARERRRLHGRGVRRGRRASWRLSRGSPGSSSISPVPTRPPAGSSSAPIRTASGGSSRSAARRTRLPLRRQAVPGAARHRRHGTRRAGRGRGRDHRW